MRHAVSIDGFLATGSEKGNVGNNLTLLVRGFGKLLLGTSKAIGYVALSTFGAWPAMAFLLYLAIIS